MFSLCPSVCAYLRADETSLDKSVRRKWLELHYFHVSWICCTACRATNPQQHTHTHTHTFNGPLSVTTCEPVPLGGNVTSVGWQVILCDPIWHVM